MTLLRFGRTWFTDRALPTRTAPPAPHLVRRFIETGDERCPLAGLWLGLAEAGPPANATPDDDGDLPWPAPWSFALGGPFHAAFTAPT